VNVFFDVDGTLICAEDGTLRPFAADVFALLRNGGHKIYVWSGAGIRREDVSRHGLAHFVSDFFTKPTSDHRNALTQLQVLAEPEFVIDDHEEVVRAFGGYTVTNYASYDPFDRGLLHAYAAFERFLADRTPDSP
jgi:hypothetical protein